MSKPHEVTLKLVIGKSTTFKKPANPSNTNYAIDDLFGAILVKALRGVDARVNPRRLENRLIPALTSLYESALTEAFKDFVGAQPVGPGAGYEVGFEGNKTLGAFDSMVKGMKNDPRMKSSSFSGMVNPAYSFLKWGALSTATMEQKIEFHRNRINAAGGKWSISGKGGKPPEQVREASKAFIHTGNLRKELTAAKRSMVTNTGVIKVMPELQRYKAGDTEMVDSKKVKVGGRFKPMSKINKTVALGTIKFKLLPKVPRSLLPGITAKDWTRGTPGVAFEAMLGLSRETQDKLANAGPKWKNAGERYKRPLLQPIFTWITMFRAPQVAAAQAAAMIRKNIKNTGDSPFAL